MLTRNVLLVGDDKTSLISVRKAFTKTEKVCVTSSVEMTFFFATVTIPFSINSITTNEFNFIIFIPNRGALHQWVSTILNRHPNAIPIIANQSNTSRDFNLEKAFPKYTRHISIHNNSCNLVESILVPLYSETRFRQSGLNTLDSTTINVLEKQITTRLNLSRNSLKNIPDQITPIFKRIKYLDLSYNRLVDIPAFFAEMSHLETLILSHNSIEEISFSFESLKMLQELHLDHNQLKNIPRSIHTLQNLQIFTIHGNPLKPLYFPYSKYEFVDKDLLESRGIYALQSAVLDDLKKSCSNIQRSIRPEIFKQLCHINVLVLGNKNLVDKIASKITRPKSLGMLTNVWKSVSEVDIPTVTPSYYFFGGSCNLYLSKAFLPSPNRSLFVIAVDSLDGFLLLVKSKCLQNEELARTPTAIRLIIATKISGNNEELTTQVHDHVKSLGMHKADAHIFNLKAKKFQELKDMIPELCATKYGTLPKVFFNLHNAVDEALAKCHDQKVLSLTELVSLTKSFLEDRRLLSEDRIVLLLNHKDSMGDIIYCPKSGWIVADVAWFFRDVLGTIFNTKRHTVSSDGVLSFYSLNELFPTVDPKTIIAVLEEKYRLCSQQMIPSLNRSLRTVNSTELNTSLSRIFARRFTSSIAPIAVTTETVTAFIYHHLKFKNQGQVDMPFANKIIFKQSSLIFALIIQNNNQQFYVDITLQFPTNTSSNKLRQYWRSITKEIRYCLEYYIGDDQKYTFLKEFPLCFACLQPVMISSNPFCQEFITNTNKFHSCETTGQKFNRFALVEPTYSIDEEEWFFVWQPLDSCVYYGQTLTLLNNNENNNENNVLNPTLKQAKTLLSISKIRSYVIPAILRAPEFDDHKLYRLGIYFRCLETECSLIFPENSSSFHIIVRADQHTNSTNLAQVSRSIIDNYINIAIEYYINDLTNDNNNETNRNYNSHSLYSSFFTMKYICPICLRNNDIDFEHFTPNDIIQNSNNNNNTDQSQYEDQDNQQEQHIQDLIEPTMQCQKTGHAFNTCELTEGFVPRYMRLRFDDVIHSQQIKGKPWTVDRNMININFRECLGTGTYGSVYVGYYKEKEIAVKKLTFRAGSLIEQFERECDHLYKLNHQHILKFFGACTEKDHEMIITELIHGGNLSQITSKQSSVSFQDRIMLIAQIASGLNYLHSNNIIHRDIKPENILIQRDKSRFIAKIADFGLSKSKRHALTMTKVKGTTKYLAPEICRGWAVKESDKNNQTRGQTNIDEAVDVFSLSFVIWQLLFTEPIFPDLAAPHQDVQRILSGGRPPIPEEKLDTDPKRQLARLIQACWAHDRQDRPTCSQIIRFLRDNCMTHKQISDANNATLLNDAAQNAVNL